MKAQPHWKGSFLYLLSFKTSIYTTKLNALNDYQTFQLNLVKNKINTYIYRNVHFSRFLIQTTGHSLAVQDLAHPAAETFQWWVIVNQHGAQDSPLRPAWGRIYTIRVNARVLV